MSSYDLQRLIRLSTTDSISSQQSEILELAKALTRQSSLWTKEGFDLEFSEICAPIASLASDVFASSFRQSVIKREASVPILSASSVILSYILNSVNASNVKKLLNPLTSLCTGSSTLDSNDKNEAIEILKNSTIFPPGFFLDEKGRPPKPAAPNFANDNNENQDSNRPQTDLTSSILVQLRSPYESKADSSAYDTDFHAFSNKNVTHLRALNAGEKLTQICFHLPGNFYENQGFFYL